MRIQFRFMCLIHFVYLLNFLKKRNEKHFRRVNTL